MKEELVTSVIQEMLPILNNKQLEELKRVLENELKGKQIVKEEKTDKMEENKDFVAKFVSSK